MTAVHILALSLMVGLGRGDAFSLIQPLNDSGNSHCRVFLAANAADADTSSSDELLKPSYDIEPIPIRIGHGFDIHRMAPLEEAGQPVVIGGVHIPHKDQKVRA